MHVTPCVRRLALGLALAALGHPAAAAAQESGREPAAPVETLADGTRRVEGTVAVARDSAMLPVPGAWVTLHRVASDRAGPLDSARTDARGAFAFRYRPTGSDDAIYFVSTTYGGIAYFTPPLRAAIVRGDDAEIAVFDTTSRPVPIRVRGRHAIVSAPESDGARTVLEVFELSNDGALTAVAAPGGRRGTWSVSLPDGAHDVRVRAGEFSTDAVATTGGRVTVFAPIAPGLKQLAFSYRMDASRFPVTLTLEEPTTVLEVLLEDPEGVARGARLAAVTPVTIEGRGFRRFLAQDVPGGATVDLDVRAGVASRAARLAVPAVLVAVGALMLGALAYAVGRGRGRSATPPRRPVAPPVAASSGAAAEATGADGPAALLAREIAALDDAHAAAAADARARGDGLTESEAEAYERGRAELKRRLAAELAREGAAR